MRRRVLLIGAVLVVAMGVGWWFDLPTRLGWREADADRLVLYGNVDIRQVQIGFRVAGRLERLTVEEGDSVKAGTILARLDLRPFEDSVRGAQADLAAQRAALDKLIAGARAAEIAQSRASVAEREADVANARQVFSRAEGLSRTGATSKADYDTALANRDMAIARLASAQEGLKLLLEGSRVEDIAAGQANFDKAQANLATAQTSMADATLAAPSDGVILSRVKEPGAILGTSDIVYVLSLTRPVWVRAYIAEPNLGRIHPGMEVLVTTDTRPQQPYRGRIGFISPTAEFTPKTVQTPELRTDLVYRLRITIDTADEGLRQGMPVTVQIPRLDPAPRR